MSYLVKLHAGTSGYDVDDIVMNRADSFKDGSYTLAPGYSK